MFHIFFSYSDLSPVPVRSAAKSYLTYWFIQNLSGRALNKLRLVTSTTWFGKLFRTLTIHAEKWKCIFELISANSIGAYSHLRFYLWCEYAGTTEPKKRFALYAFVKPILVPRASAYTYLAFDTIFEGVWKCASVTDCIILGLQNRVRVSFMVSIRLIHYSAI